MNKRVLAWVNRYRLQHNVGPPLDALPKGVQGDNTRCPVARGLGKSCMSMGIPTPPLYVKEAMWRFDAGKYPDLIERP